MCVGKHFTYFEFFSSIDYQPSFTTLLTLLIQPMLATWIITQEFVLPKQGPLGPFGSLYCVFTYNEYLEMVVNLNNYARMLVEGFFVVIR
jgi:hypothetical protein